MPFPFRFEGSHIHDDSAARVQVDLPKQIVRTSRGMRKLLHTSRQSEGIRRYDTNIGVNIDQRLWIKVFRIDNRVENVGEDLEFAARLASRTHSWKARS